MKAVIGATILSVASATELTTCTGSSDPAVSSGVCYQGSTLGETIKIDLKSFANSKGTMSLTATGLKGFTCADHDFTKVGQDITVDLSDCLPSGVTVESVKYCSDSDQIVVAVKDGLEIKATASKVACGGANYAAEWNHFKNEYKKTYASAIEEEQRFQIFRVNMDFIAAMNSKGSSFQMGVTPFADLTADEFGTSHFGIAAPAKPWGSLPNLGNHTYNGEALAASIDWTSKGAVTPVKNQGQCGSCWSFSTTGSLEGAWEIASGKLVSLSEQQFVDCDKVDSGCNGGLMDNAFQYAEQNSLCTEGSYPYKARSGTCKASSCTVGIKKGSVIGFKDVSADSEQAMMSALNKQPVSIAIEADKSVFQLYKSGVLSGYCGATLDHGVLAVGYGTESGKDYWLVKNSWGASWGLNGYIKLLRGKGGSGECGLLKQASYPVVKASSDVVV